MKPTAAVAHAFESHLNATCAFSALTVSDVLVRIHLLHSYVPSQSDFQPFYGGVQHLADIDAVIENDLFIIRDLVLDLGIVVKDHQLYKAAAYKIGDSETSKKAWQALFASLQRKLLQRLKNAQSYCKLSQLPHGDFSRCKFCKRNYEFLESQEDAPDVSHEAT
jgi:hypothetical protein